MLLAFGRRAAGRAARRRCEGHRRQAGSSVEWRYGEVEHDEFVENVRGAGGVLGASGRPRRLVRRARVGDTSAFAQVSPVADKIIVNGANRGDVDAIKGYFTGTDQASVNRAVGDLSATGMFTKVSAKIVGDTVVVNVVEGAQIVNRVAFEGNSKLKGDQLGVEVQSKAYSRVQQGRRRRRHRPHQGGLQEDRPQ